MSMLELFSAEYNAYPVNFDVYGEGLSPFYMIYDDKGLVPMMKFFEAQDDGKFENIGEYYAVLVPLEKSYMWRLVDSEAGDIRAIIPLNDEWFPANWYIGTWTCDDGSELTFADGKVYAQGQEFGTLTVSDNRLAVRTPNNERDVIFAILDVDTGSCVMTFTSGPNGMGENAGGFTRTSTPAPSFPTKQPQAPTFPNTQAPQTPAQPPMPQNFPRILHNLKEFGAQS